MDVFVALLRAVNVGGTGKLTMAELTSICVAAGSAPFARQGPAVMSYSVTLAVRPLCARPSPAV